MEEMGHFPMIENYPVFRRFLLPELEWMAQLMDVMNVTAASDLPWYRQVSKRAVARLLGHVHRLGR